MIDEEVQNSLNLEYATVQPSLNFTTPTQIKDYIKPLPHRKTPGEDMIPNIVLQNLSTKAIVYLVIIYNACLRYPLDKPFKFNIQIIGKSSSSHNF